jgi:Orthopoxvirus protein of unknown function (DUF830).
MMNIYFDEDIKIFPDKIDYNEIIKSMEEHIVLSSSFNDNKNITVINRSKSSIMDKDNINKEKNIINENLKHISHYTPKKYDHISRQLIVMNLTFLKHHGIIIEPNEEDVLESTVLHFYGDDKKTATIRTTTLKDFFVDDKKINVYYHEKDELNEVDVIEKKIKESLKKYGKYDFINNNCEDFVCDVLLKPESKYIKQTIIVFNNLYTINPYYFKVIDNNKKDTYFIN